MLRLTLLLSIPVVLLSLVSCSSGRSEAEMRAEQQRLFIAQELEHARLELGREVNSRLQGFVFQGAEPEILARLKREALDVARREFKEGLKEEIRKEVIEEMASRCIITCPGAPCGAGKSGSTAPSGISE